MERADLIGCHHAWVKISYFSIKVSTADFESLTIMSKAESIPKLRLAASVKLLVLYYTAMTF
jgi:hypothetical protein